MVMPYGNKALKRPRRAPSSIPAKAHSLNKELVGGRRLSGPCEFPATAKAGQFFILLQNSIALTSISRQQKVFGYRCSKKCKKDQPNLLPNLDMSFQIEFLQNWRCDGEEFGALKADPLDS